MAMDQRQHKPASRRLFNTIRKLWEDRKLRISHSLGDQERTQLCLSNQVRWKPDFILFFRNRRGRVRLSLLGTQIALCEFHALTHQFKRAEHDHLGIFIYPKRMGRGQVEQVPSYHDFLRSVLVADMKSAF